MKLAALCMIALLILSCNAHRVPRKYNDVKEVESVDLTNWQGWVVLQYPDSRHAIIRSEKRIIKVKVPEWFGMTFAVNDTIR